MDACKAYIISPSYFSKYIISNNTPIKRKQYMYNIIILYGYLLTKIYYLIKAFAYFE